MKKKLSRVLFLIAVIVLTIFHITFKSKYKEKLNLVSGEKDKYYRYYILLNNWLKIRESGSGLAPFFKHNHYKRIAVYGMGALGQRILDDLQDSDLEILYGIDQNTSINLRHNIKVVNPDSEFEDVDCIVVSPFLEYCRIEELLYGKISGDIISLEEVIDYLDCTGKADKC